MNKKAGASTRQMAQKRRRTSNYILIGVFILGIILMCVINNWQALGLGGGTVLVLLVIFILLPNLIDKYDKRREKAERRADRGAAAEEVVGELLANLNEDFLVLHDISCPYGNIDHIVIGKNSGVFLLETKAHGGRIQILPDRLLVNSKPPEKDFIAQTLRNTYWLRDELERVTGKKVWINAVIVFTNAFVPFGKPIKGIHVTNKKFLLDMLQKQARSSTDLSTIWNTRNQIVQQLINQE